MVDLANLERIGPYATPRYVAQGGMAWVFVVPDPDFPTRQLALKLLKPEAAQGDELRMFRREAELLAGIDHPNLVTIFGLGQDDGTGCFYYTMSFIDGPSLAQLVVSQPDQQLPVDEACRLILGVLEGLEQLHDRQIVHRDIKPGNILVAGRGSRAVLMDLGIARELPQSELTQYTHTAVIRGTPLYMSPEQSEGKAVKPSSDVFSVGLTLYYLIVGHTAYDEVEGVDTRNPQSVRNYLGYLTHSQEQFTLKLPRHVPRAVAAVVKKACRLDPGDRYADAREMHEALSKALQERPGTSRVHWPLVAAIGGAAALTVGGLLGYDYWTSRQEAERQRVSATEIQQSVEALLERTAALSPQPPSELLAEVQRTRDYGDNLFNDAEFDWEAGERRLAADGYGKSVRNFESSCRKLNEHLGVRADTAAQGANQRMEGLAKAGAPEHVKASWKEADALRAGLEPPAPGTADCATADAHLDRIAASTAVHDAVQELEKELSQVWPQLAQAARRDALAARTRAGAAGVDVTAREYLEAIAAADAAFAQAQSLQESGSFLSSRDAYAEAAAAYARAEAIAPAALARAEKERLEGQIAESGTAPEARFSMLVARADEFYAAGSWDAATQAYQEAIELGKTFLDKSQLNERVLEARSRAGVTRDSASAEGAALSAAATFSRGAGEFEEGEQALAAEDYERALAAFEKARETFAEARTEVYAALAEAREEEIQTRQELDTRLAGGCAALESTAARDDCQAAESAFARAGTALAAKDVPGARSELQDALKAAERAASAEEMFRRTKQYPPELVAYAPEKLTLEATRGQALSFSIEARDSNPDDTLAYSWSFAGERLRGATGPEAEIRPRKDGQMVVSVTDGRGGAITRSWDVVVRNREPVLAVSPSTRTVKLEAGQSREFAATASDPDGDPTSVEYRVDGQTVGTGTSYTFEAVRPGRFQLQVIATDEGGGRVVESRRIEVASVRPPPRTPPTTTAAAKPPPPKPTPAATPPPPKSTPTSTPAPAPVAKPPAPTRVAAVTPPPPPPAPPAPKPQTGWRGALSRYEAAIEAKDMEKLQQVWPRISDHGLYYKRWVTKFRKPEPLTVSIQNPRVVKEGGEQITVEFSQQEVEGSRRGRPRKYEAVLVRRGASDDWQILRMALKRG